MPEIRKVDFVALLRYDLKGRTTPAFSGYRPDIEFEGMPGMLTCGDQKFLDKDEIRSMIKI